ESPRVVRFPYTTLFRSSVSWWEPVAAETGAIHNCFFAAQTANCPSGESRISSQSSSGHPISPSRRGSPRSTSTAQTCCFRGQTRSEEHTSELQSRGHLV